MRTSLESVPEDAEHVRPSVPVPQPKVELSRDFSKRSLGALKQIGEIGSSLSEHESRLKQVKDALTDGSLSVGEAKDTLAQLHGSTFKVLTKQVDAVDTSELNSGK